MKQYVRKWSDVQDGVLMISFNRQKAINQIDGMSMELPADVELKVTRKLNNEVPFEGIDTIRVVKHRKK